MYSSCSSVFPMSPMAETYSSLFWHRNSVTRSLIKKNKQLSILKAEKQTALRIQDFQLILTVLSFYLLYPQRVLMIYCKSYVADISTKMDKFLFNFSISYLLCSTSIVIISIFRIIQHLYAERTEFCSAVQASNFSA